MALMGANPVDVVTHLLPLQPGKAVRQEHQPAMPWATVPSFVKAELVDAGELEVTRNALLFLVLNASRSGEVRGMTWSEVNLRAKLWTIPAARMKAKVAHRVPLSLQAIELLKRQAGQHDELVFPSVQARTVMSDMTLTALLRRAKAPSDTPGRVATVHGFRSSFRDWCSERGYPRDLAERALAHTVKDKVEAAYHRTDLFEQRRPMMQAWADKLGQAEARLAQIGVKRSPHGKTPRRILVCVSPARITQPPALRIAWRFCPALSCPARRHCLRKRCP